MKKFLNDYSLALVELALYALSHIYTGKLGSIFALAFSIGIIMIVMVGIYKDYSKNQKLQWEVYKGYYIILGLLFIYGIMGITRSIVELMKA